MTPDDIRQSLTNSPALHMLRLQNARWMLPFLYQVFKVENRFTIDEKLLVQLLAGTLADQADGTEDTTEAGIPFGENEEVRARKYLNDWVKRRVLQDLTDMDGAVQYQLSAYTERVFQWMASLQGAQHVGTESRFRLLFNSLRDIVEHTEDNARKRLELLRDKKAEIEKEIRALELGRAPESYNNSQVQERIDLFTKLCYELIGDFREVGDNFRQIHRNIVAHHTRAEKHKGAILGYAFEAYDALRQSPQGKSFYAFWDFLISRAGQEEWNEMTGQLLEMLRERNITADEAFVRNTKSILLEQGRRVYEANDKMAEKLSRIISEKEIERHRRLRRQINSIKELVFDLMDAPEDPDCGLSTEGSADIRLIMDRRMQLAPREQPAPIDQPSLAKEIITDPARLARMMSHPHIDKKKLWEQVELVLERQQVASLSEVLELTPITHGLAEVIGYFQLIREKPGKSSIVSTATELIPLNAERTRFVEVPYLLFNA